MAATETLPPFPVKLFLIFLHIGCSRPKRKLLSFLNRIFSPNRNISVTSPRNNLHLDDEPPHKRRTGYPLFPCSYCGEIFTKQSLFDQHNSTEHAVSELREGDPSNNVVQIIFNSGWNDSLRQPRIHRILKIHNSRKILARFEEYRELVKTRAAAPRNGVVWRIDERCLVDGNELLRFHCTTFVCDLGQNGKSALCSHQFCGVCGVIRGGFSAKLDGIATLATGWSAHVAVPDDVEDDFAFMSVKRAVLVCRVVAGRVGCDPMVGMEKGDPGFERLIQGLCFLFSLSCTLFERFGIISFQLDYVRVG